MNTWEIARRDLLKQLGVGLACLPVLHHSRAWAQAETVPKKLMIFLASEGYRMAQWKPPVGPLGATLPQSCMPLAKHKDDLIFLPDMTNPNYKGGERFGHEAYGSIFWGGASTKGSNKYQEPTGSTFDQVIADGLPKKKEVSLAFQLQLDRLPKQAVPGGNRCFWRNGGAINPDFNPTASYARIFGALARCRARHGARSQGQATAGSEERASSTTSARASRSSRHASRREDRKVIDAALHDHSRAGRPAVGYGADAAHGQVWRGRAAHVHQRRHHGPGQDLAGHHALVHEHDDCWFGLRRDQRCDPAGGRFHRQRRSTSAPSFLASRRAAPATSRPSATGTISATTPAWAASTITGSWTSGA